MRSVINSGSLSGFLAVVLVWSTPPAWAQNDSADNEPAAKALAVIAEAQDAGHLHGVAAVIDASGKSLRRAAGVEHAPDGTPISADSKFRIASLTKLFTQIAVLQLVDAGKLDLDESVATYRPNFKAPWAREVTVRQLLAFRSGLPRESGADPIADGVQYDEQGSALTYLDALVTPGPSVPPGQRTSYSNLGYFHLGGVIEAVTNKPLADVVQEQIIDRLQLQDTGFAADELGQDGHVRGHRIQADGAITAVDDFPISPRYCAGGMHSSLRDLELVTAAVQSGTLLSAKSTQELFEQFGRTKDSANAIQAAGHVPGFANTVLISREPKFAIVLLNNAVGQSPQAVIDTLQKAAAEFPQHSSAVEDMPDPKLAKEGWTEVKSVEQIPAHAVLERVTVLLEAIDGGSRENYIAAAAYIQNFDLETLDADTRQDLQRAFGYEFSVLEKYGPFELTAWRLGEEDSLEVYLRGPEGRALRYRFAESKKTPGVVGVKGHATIGFRPDVSNQ